jgi:hypothetical protein
MGEVIQFPRAPRAPYFILAWDQRGNTCRLDYVHSCGTREHIGSARQCAHDARLPLVDQIDPVIGMQRR